MRGVVMILKTRVFELCNGRYRNLSELAKAMGISVSQIYRVREGKRHINQKFLIGAIKAFPEHKLDDLFYLSWQMSPNVPKPSPNELAIKDIRQLALSTSTWEWFHVKVTRFGVLLPKGFLNSLRCSNHPGRFHDLSTHPLTYQRNSQYIHSSSEYTPAYPRVRNNHSGTSMTTDAGIWPTPTLF